MKRLKSIDIFRGLSMVWVLVAHLQHWWLRLEDMWLYDFTWMIFDVMGASGFLFIGGVSTSISYKNRISKANNSENYNTNMIRGEYMFRAFCILLLALLFNFFVVIGTNDITQIWTWFVLLTVAVSLFMAWPLLKTLKIFRILLGAIIWILNQLILEFLTYFKGTLNIYGILYYILYNTIDLDPILSFFPFFLFGTVIGDIIFDVYNIENPIERKSALKKKLILPFFIVGGLLISSGIIFQFPTFLEHRTFPWMIYALGVEITFLSFLISGEEFIIGETEKSYKFLYYFSYYSLTLYLSHNLLYPLFLRRLNAVNIWIYILITTIITGLILRTMYKKFGQKASIKITIGRIGSGLMRKIEEIKKEKLIKSN